MEKYIKEDLWYRDWRFWLLTLVINMSGNICISSPFLYKTILILLFGYISCQIFKEKILSYRETIFILIWLSILLFQHYYIQINYSFSSNLHFFLKIFIGVYSLYLIREKFITYYCNIIYFFTIISLFCFLCNCMGYIFPFIFLDNYIDNQHVFRVSSIVYTQLYNLSSGEITLRNCGPFWEPGAFQGFINLAIVLQLLTYKEESFKWRIKMLVYTIGVITTFSTGGYIVLFINIIYYLMHSGRIYKQAKIIYIIILFILGVSIFFTVSFLHDKISTDTARLGVSLDDIGTGLYMIFGYGLGENSINESEIKSASSVFNLFRYVGIIGFILYFAPIFMEKLYKDCLYFILCIFLILMNEPFITSGPFWWCVPFLWRIIEPFNKTKEKYEFFH